MKKEKNVDGRDPIFEFLNAYILKLESSRVGSILSSKEANKDIINIPKKKFSDKISKRLSKDY